MAELNLVPATDTRCLAATNYYLVDPLSVDDDVSSADRNQHQSRDWWYQTLV